MNKPPVAGGLQAYRQHYKTVTFTDASTDRNGDTITSSVNWGDGSALSTGGAGTVFTHTYSDNGKFKIVHTATDPGGMNNKESKAVSITDILSTTGNLNITTTGTLTAKKITYYVKNSSGLTKKYGTVNIGSSTGDIELVSDNYRVYLYFPFGGGCISTYVNGTVFTVGTGTQTIAVGCN